MMLGLCKVAGVKVYLRQTWNFRSRAVSACISLWCHRPMHAPHRLMHACTACIAPWCHRLMHTVTAWALLFWFRLGYTFSPASLRIIGSWYMKPRREPFLDLKEYLHVRFSSAFWGIFMKSIRNTKMCSWWQFGWWRFGQKSYRWEKWSWEI